MGKNQSLGSEAQIVRRTNTIYGFINLKVHLEKVETCWRIRSRLSKKCRSERWRGLHTSYIFQLFERFFYTSCHEVLFLRNPTFYIRCIQPIFYPSQPGIVKEFDDNFHSCFEKVLCRKCCLVFPHILSFPLLTRSTLLLQSSSSLLKVYPT